MLACTVRFMKEDIATPSCQRSSILAPSEHSASLSDPSFKGPAISHMLEMTAERTLEPVAVARHGETGLAQKYGATDGPEAVLCTTSSLQRALCDLRPRLLWLGPLSALGSDRLVRPRNAQMSHGRCCGATCALPVASGQAGAS